MRRATPEQIQDFVKAEMKVFDTLPACVRRVMTEHAEGMYLIPLFQNNPGSYELAFQEPQRFARILKKTMDKLAEEQTDRRNAELIRMMKELKNA